MYPRPRCFKALKNQIKPKLKSSKLNYWNPVAQKVLLSHTLQNDTVSNLVFWSCLVNKLKPWHLVYIMQQ